MNKKTIILEYIEAEANIKEIEFIYNLISLPKYPNKIDLLELINENYKTINFDYSIPIDLYREIEKIYKNINKGNLIFDYTNNNFGELLNINDLLASYIVRLKNDN